MGIVDKQKVALITGSTKGIGKQIAIDLLKKGCFVILNYANSSENADKVRSELSTISSDFTIIKADVSCLKGLEEIVAAVKDVTSTVDYLILNASITKRIPFEKITIDDWNEVINANLTIPFFLIQKMNFFMQPNGRIIFMGALMGMVPHAISIPYGVSKASLGMLAKYLVKFFADRKITVNVLAPGFVETPWQMCKEPEHRQRIEDKIAIGRFATVKEISSTCLHLIDNGYINGQVLVVDGGYE